MKNLSGNNFVARTPFKSFTVGEIVNVLGSVKSEIKE